MSEPSARAVEQASQIIHSWGLDPRTGELRNTRELRTAIAYALDAACVDAGARGEALRRYVDHLESCDIYPVPDGCTCGLVALLRSLPPPTAGA